MEGSDLKNNPAASGSGIQEDDSNQGDTTTTSGMFSLVQGFVWVPYLLFL